jgi:hypothetical protein
MGWRGEKDVHLPLYVCHCLLGVVAQCNTSTTKGGEGGGRELGRLGIKCQGGPIWTFLLDKFHTNPNLPCVIF